jgi:hypothetical protein
MKTLLVVITTTLTDADTYSLLLTNLLLKLVQQNISQRSKNVSACHGYTDGENGSSQVRIESTLFYLQILVFFETRCTSIMKISHIPKLGTTLKLGSLPPPPTCTVHVYVKSILCFCAILHCCTIVSAMKVIWEREFTYIVSDVEERIIGWNDIQWYSTYGWKHAAAVKWMHMFRLTGEWLKTSRNQWNEIITAQHYITDWTDLVIPILRTSSWENYFQ